MNDECQEKCGMSLEELEKLQISDDDKIFLENFEKESFLKLEILEKERDEIMKNRSQINHEIYCYETLQNYSLDINLKKEELNELIKKYDEKDKLIDSLYEEIDICIENIYKKYITEI
jgi:hypothetical protein